MQILIEVIVCTSEVVCIYCNKNAVLETDEFRDIWKITFSRVYGFKCSAGAASLVLANAFYFIYRKPKQGQDTAE